MMPPGCSVEDYKFVVTSGETEQQSVHTPRVVELGLDTTWRELEQDALRAVLSRHDIGKVHRGGPAAEIRYPAMRSHNVSYGRSVTASSFTPAPRDPIPLPVREDNLPASSKMHNRRLGNARGNIIVTPNGAFIR